MQRKLLLAFAFALAGIFVEYALGFVRTIWSFSEFQQASYTDADFVSWSDLLLPVENLAAVFGAIFAYRIVDRQWLLKPNNRAINLVGANITNYAYGFLGTSVAMVLLDGGQWFTRPTTVIQVFIGFVWPLALGAFGLVSLLFAMHRYSEFGKSHALRFDNPAEVVHHQKVVMLYPIAGLAIFLSGVVVAFVANGRRFDLICDPLLLAFLGLVIWHANKSYWFLRETDPVRDEWSEEAPTDPDDIHDNTEELGRGLGWVSYIGLIGFFIVTGQIAPSMVTAAFSASTVPLKPLFSYLDAHWWLTSALPNIVMSILFLSLFWLAITRWLFGKDLRKTLLPAGE
jgi:hypothetical protein